MYVQLSNLPASFLWFLFLKVLLLKPILLLALS